ncbi:LysR family transcriptional regulator [Arthrobacter sp. 35W]|uniref:LysR family transcriptional regulator n=1 Tax=Arthrobacter sp. 35W TaxID=1132441 RepID=UPI0003F7EBC3|nr:LysR family transcriptional regulator [Arthrobacter sp. 35W]
MERSEYQDLAALLPVLPILVQLGETGHVTAAAELLGIPQPTVSRALARASAVVGTPLTVREGRGIRLTPAAHLLLPRMTAALAEVSGALAAAREEAGRSYGRIAVAFQHTFGEATVPLLIQRFARDHPGVSFDLSQGSRSFALDALAAGTADLAIVAPPPESAGSGRGLSAQLLYTEPLRLVVPRGHRLEHGGPVRLDQVRDEGFVLLEPGYGMRSIVEALCREAGFRPRVAFEGQDSHTIRGLVSAGLGVSVLPPSGGDHLTPAGSELGWAEVDILEPVASRGIGLVWRNRSDEPAQVRRFRELVLGEGVELLRRALGADGG